MKFYMYNIFEIKGKIMNSAEKTIKSLNMFKKGEKVAVACSGGKDSMSLLHFLNTNKREFGIEICAINVNHGIRENSTDDSKFVEDFCERNGVVCYRFNIDVPTLCKQEKSGVEETARNARYRVFDTIIKKGIADKIAIAHHQQDQIETVLLNIFRGSGLKGASGMKAIQNNYVRPLLYTTKAEIEEYIKQNNIPFVEDQTNTDDTYSRNYIRLTILPQLRKHWKNIDAIILNFSNICRQDDDYILSTIDFDDIVLDANCVHIPLHYFALPLPAQNRVLKFCFEKLNLTKDVERRHLDILKNLVKTGKNGSKINLPNKLKASLEYDCLTIYAKSHSGKFEEKDFKTGKTNFENYASVTIKKVDKFDVFAENCHVIDAKKLPKNVIWRKRKEGDVFTKFGSGEKKLKDYLIDKKIPNRLRDNIPVLASGNEVFCVLGLEISDKVKTDENTQKAYVITYKKYQS